MRKGVRMKDTDHLLQYVQKFFQEYLRIHRGMSPNTVFAYRDAIKLFMLFLTTSTGRKATKLTLDHLHADAVLAFLGDIEAKGNSATTRNLRLSALRTFFGYPVTQDPLRVGQYQKVIAIPFKQASQPLMDYLTVDEVKAIFQTIEETTPKNRRDYALISLLYNTGARVQEICDLRGEDIVAAPPSVIVTGKGRKTRQIPLWAETATILKAYLKGRDLRERVFLNARGLPLTRFGVHHIINVRIKAAATICPQLATKNVSPHTFRHTTAMHLLQSGVELTVIKSWLGHVNIATTHGYIEIDLEMKKQALAQCATVNNRKLDELVSKNNDLISWLSSL